MENAGKRVGGYARFSPDDGTKVSIGMQRDVIGEACRTKGWGLAAFRYDENVSGAVPLEERPGLQELVDMAEAGRFELLMVMEVSRLARDQAMFWTIVGRLSQRGVLVTTAMMPDLTSEKPEFQMVAGVLQAEASFQRILTKVKTKAALKVLKEGGFHVGRAPTGYELRPTEGGHKELVLDKLGRLVFAEYQANHGVKAVFLAKELEVPYTTAYHALRNVKKYGDGSALRKRHPSGAVVPPSSPAP